MSPGEYIIYLSGTVATVPVGMKKWRLDIQWHEEWTETGLSRECWGELVDATAPHGERLEEIRLVRSCEAWDGVGISKAMRLLSVEGRRVVTVVDEDFCLW